MKSSNLHLTALEITHSLTAPEIEQLAAQLRPHAEEICNYTLRHRARLLKPLLSFDAQALALSFLPAAGEPDAAKSTANDDIDIDDDDDDDDDDASGHAYTYHHLRRDLFARVQAAGVVVASRYVIPSAHLTIGRFVTAEDFAMGGGVGGVDRGKVAELLGVIEEINAWLRAEFWPRDDGTIKDGGQWTVGEERGLDFRKGALWYGSGGETVLLGKGF